MQTKYPILLVHGIVLKESRIFRAFGKIGKKLKEQGYCVYVAKHDGFGTIAGNAAQIKAEIEGILQKENTEKINLIAHSKGGLDCKYLIRELEMEGRVASLTTLCTPHKGSPVASRIMKFPKFLLKIVAFWIDFWYRIFGDKHPDSFQVCKELERHDEEEPLLSPDIYCQSFSTKMERVRDDFCMGIPYVFSRYCEKGETDGLVPVDSAKFANYRGNFSDSVSHSQIVGFSGSKKKKEKVYAFYSTICEELAAMNL